MMATHASKCPPLPPGSVELGAIEAAARKGDEALAKAIDALTAPATPAPADPPVALESSADKA